MKKTFLLLVLCLLMPCCLSEGCEEWIAAIGAYTGAEQMVIVSAGSAPDRSVLYMAELVAGEWKAMLETAAVTGKNGTGKTKEGDKKTPAGIYGFTLAFGNGEDPGCALGYYRVTKDDYWSGDMREGYGYNTLVSIKDLPHLNRDASEHLSEYTVSYKYCLNISYNADCVSGRGSAIFLHCLKPGRTYTSGCIAIPESSMLFVMQHVQEGCAVIIDRSDRLMSGEWADAYAS